MDRTKKFAALARVSSREQEREGFSLDVQEDALRLYAERNDGEIVRFFRIAETASKHDERTTFKELLAFAKEHAVELDGLLFYKVDRAARNLFDYVELERLESESGIRFISVSQPTENTPAGRMQRRMLASMASFYTEQQSLDVREGMNRRVQSGLFVTKAPYGYKNIRINGRGAVQIDPMNGPKVQRIFDLYGHGFHTLDSLANALLEEGIEYLPSVKKVPRSKLHTILTDRSYLGELRHHKAWFPGTHEPLVDQDTWDRVQFFLGEKIYHAHQMTYASEFMTCGFCGNPITGEKKIKQTSTGEREYVYYRCTKYHVGDHPRVRVTERDLDMQMLALFDKMRVEDEDFRKSFVEQLKAATEDDFEKNSLEDDVIREQQKKACNRVTTLTKMRLDGEIDHETYADMFPKLKDEEARLRLHLDRKARTCFEISNIAVKAFELSQVLREKWVRADYAVKRRILEILCLNCRLDDISLVPIMRKPFDLLAEGLLLKNSRDDRI